MPTGSAISARRTCDCRRAASSATVAPLGTTRWVVSSAAVTPGVNGTFAQPVGVKDADAVVSASIVVVAGAHDVGSVMKVLSSVRSSAEPERAGVERGDRRVQPAVGPQRHRRLVLDQEPMPRMPSRAGSPGCGSRL